MALCLAGSLAQAETPADWPHWRGPLDNGSTERGSYPSTWDAKNVLWKAPLPGKGCSTPVVCQHRIFLTAPVAGKDAVLALDWSGKPLWQTFWVRNGKESTATARGAIHSPVTDGRGVFVYFKSGAVAAVELDGTLRWKNQSSGPLRQGHSLLGRRLFARVDREGRRGGSDAPRRFLPGCAGQAERELHWKVPRNYPTPEEGDHGLCHGRWSCSGKGSRSCWCGGPRSYGARTPATARPLWSCGDFNPQAQRKLGVGGLARAGGRDRRGPLRQGNMPARHPPGRPRRRHHEQSSLEAQRHRLLRPHAGRVSRPRVSAPRPR